MDYETPDGSQFSLQEVFDDHDGEAVFKYTSITAFVDGKAFAGKADSRMHDVDDVDIVNDLKPVPTENINPLFPTGFTRAPTVELAEHYLKAPSFTYEDSEPGRTFVADCLLNEATVWEELKKQPHPNIVKYYGCVVTEANRIAQLCLKRYHCSLAEYAGLRLPDHQRESIFAGVQSAVEHLHSFGLAHNDLCPQNICIDSDSNAAIVDFDSCLPFGQKLMKGVAADGLPLRSDPQNDLEALEDLKDFLADLSCDDDVTTGAVDGGREAMLLPSNMSPEY